MPEHVQTESAFLAVDLCSVHCRIKNLWKEFAKELGSWKKAGWNLQKSHVPAKELEGIHERVPFLKKNSKEFARGCRRCPGFCVRLICGNQAGEQPQSFLVGSWKSFHILRCMKISLVALGVSDLAKP